MTNNYNQGGHELPGKDGSSDGEGQRYAELAATHVGHNHWSVQDWIMTR